jgi:hypothetical protein
MITLMKSGPVYLKFNEISQRYVLIIHDMSLRTFNTREEGVREFCKVSGTRHPGKAA